MLLAVLYLILTVVVFVGATVVAAWVMTRTRTRSGSTRGANVDAAMVSYLRSRRRRLDRRLGIQEDASTEAPDTSPLSSAE